MASSSVLTVPGVAPWALDLRLCCGVVDLAPLLQPHWAFKSPIHGAGACPPELLYQMLIPLLLFLLVFVYVFSILFIRREAHVL